MFSFCFFLSFLFSHVIHLSITNRKKMSSKASGKNGTGGTRSKNKLDKIAVNLEYACYICGNILSSPKQTINHVRKTHGRELPTRASK